MPRKKAKSATATVMVATDEYRALCALLERIRELAEEDSTLYGILDELGLTGVDD